MIDPVLGDIIFTDANGWQSTYSYPFLGREVTVDLLLGGFDGEPPFEPIQRKAMERFNMRKGQLCAEADDALYGYYRERLPDLRHQFGDSADELMPIITDIQGLAALVTPTAFLIDRPATPDDDERVIGLLFDCTWDTSLGLAVRIVDETIDEVGPQDIIL
ncbi:DUF6985 domain-containing protein [Mycobacteroides chelonae]|uniref:DUF6985 domain-containing protein n=1 Tax=Mycobacteroides chelonae TaxID=1774 RepID=UPI00099276AE|nr:hypothetical protein [Mycobacteroides chelonae]